MSDFEIWWEEVGGEISPTAEDRSVEDFARKIASVAWYASREKVITKIYQEIKNEKK